MAQLHLTWLNRTFMELKLIDGVDCVDVTVGLNRTFMELKCSFAIMAT